MGTETSRINTAERVFDRAQVLELFDRVLVPGLLAREFDRVPGLELFDRVLVPGLLAREFDRVPVLLAREFVRVAGPAPCPRIVQLAVAAIVSVVINLRWAVVVARSAVAAETSLALAAAEAVKAWAAAGSAVAVAVVAAERDAGDEQFTNGTKTYEIEIQHHEAVKNFLGRLCDHLVRFGRVCIAGRTARDQAGCDERFRRNHSMSQP